MNMETVKKTVYEPGLLLIFRMFCGAVAAVFFIFSADPPAYFPLIIDAQTWFWMGMCYAAMFFYLLFPMIMKTLGRLYLPLAIIASILTPIILLSWRPFTDESTYLQVSIASGYSISILLMFPLIITAWHYEFKVVLLFFGVLGGIDPIIYLITLGPEAIDLSAAFYSSLIRIVVFAGIGFVVTELMRNQRERQSALQSANSKLNEQAHFARELSAAQERNRIAHELHDVLAHTLSSLAVQLEAVKANLPDDIETSRTLLDKALDNTRSGLRETRRTVRDLRAQPLEDLGFREAVAALVEETRERSGLPISTELDTALGMLRHSDEHSVYRIIGEALENIIRHAHADSVTIRLEQLSHEYLELTISDDGIGFSPEKTDEQRHFGLQFMRERAKSIGARFSIESDNSGTVIRVLLRSRR